jgi:hypothetical protein
LHCICQQSDDDVEDEDILVLTDYTQITGVYLYKEGANEECLFDAKKAKKLVEDGLVDPNRVFVHYKLRATDKNEEINLWDELIFDNYESILRSFLTRVKQKDMTFSGGKYAYGELERCMKDAQLVEARRDPDNKVNWAVTKLARLNKEKTLASKVLEVESGEPTTDAPPQVSELDMNMCDTQESYNSAVGADIYEIDKNLIDDDSDASFASDV